MAESSEQVVRLERQGGIAVLRLDRPPVNAIDLSVLRQADERLRDLERADDVGAVVVTGAGRCFSAGLDLKAVPRYSPAEQRETVLTLNRVVLRLYRLPMPTLAAVNGHAIAGGLVLVLACDYRIGRNVDCELGLTEARAGVPFPAAPMAVVQAELSPPVVRRLTLLARNAGPEPALRDGILDELQPPEQVFARALELAEELARTPRTAYARVKLQFRRAVIDRLEKLVDADADPLLDSWLSGETGGAAASLLRDKK